ncbi:MAG: ThuA domain-containing protein [Verrucomicrobia bacterium]|nr:ThuA domain-containing protein [Verrucomicrobiota bacterium]
MKTPETRLFSLLGLGLFLFGATPVRAAEPIRLLVMTGGHEFETNQFLDLFKADTNLVFQNVAHPHAHAWLDPDLAKRFDVLVLYDLWQDITGTAETNLLRWVRSGKGIVALHHSLADYQAWDDYARIIGGKYYLEPTNVHGIPQPRSTYLHDVHFHVHVADPNHPVTRGVTNFDIVDETYGKFEVAPRVHVLLTTDTPTSSPIIGWAQTIGTARIVYLQLGHGHTAYGNPNYRRLVAQAIQWTAKRDAAEDGRAGP